MRKGYFRDGIDKELFHNDGLVMRKFELKLTEIWYMLLTYPHTTSTWTYIMGINSDC